MNQFISNNNNGVQYFTTQALDLLGIKHAFSTRNGGVSEGAFATWNLGFNRGDKIENVLENYRRFADILNVRVEDFVLTKQTHNDVIEIITEDDKGKGITKPGFEDADALITNVPGVVLCCFFADCVPILLYDQKKRVCAAVHSGWKGTALKIGSKTVQKMVKEFTSDPKDIIAVIGPSIGKCHFEVEEDVAETLREVCSNEKAFEKTGAKYHVDLWLINKELLLCEGVLEQHITITEDCTVCGQEQYFSHRRMGDNRGSLAAAIVL